MKGICQSCGKISELISCSACGARCCQECVDNKSKFCKLCHGIKEIR